MYHQNNLLNHKKISLEFANRLSSLQPQHKVHVIVMLQLGNAVKNRNSHQSPSERKAAIKAIHTSAKQALGYVRNIVQEFGGKQLAESPNALGFIPIEISAAGVNALAQSDAVKAVMEDQEIHPVDGTNSYEL